MDQEHGCGAVEGCRGPIQELGFDPKEAEVGRSGLAQLGEVLGPGMGLGEVLGPDRGLVRRNGLEGRG